MPELCPFNAALCYYEAMKTETLGKSSDLPCPVCQTKLIVRAAGRQEALVWCETCGWNLAGTGKYLRSRNLWLFVNTLWWLPLVIPIALFIHSRAPHLGYGLDTLLIMGFFAPAFIRSQANIAMARRVESFKPAGRAVEHVGWNLEPALRQASPRPVQLRGSTAPIRGLLHILRALWAILFVAGLFALTPLAQVAGPRVQYAAILLMAFAVPPLFASLVALIGVVWRQRHLIVKGYPCEGRIVFHMTHLRRLAKGEWILSCRYRYHFTDPHGTEREGMDREEGRAIIVGSPVTILDSPKDPRWHGSYPANLYASVGSLEAVGSVR